MTSGSPPANYYASTPLIAQRLDPWRGIFHGDNKSPKEKYLAEMMLVTPSAGAVGLWTLMDYLLYYPFIDMDEGDSQVPDNSIAIDRYIDGVGVQAMLFAQSPTTGSGTFTFNYINQAGVEHTSPVQTCGSTSCNYGSCVTHQPATTMGAKGPYLELAAGDTGIRRVVSFQNVVNNGGLGVLVLVKPLAHIVISEINCPVEVSFVMTRPGAPRIYDGAFLGFACCTVSSVAAALLSGRIKTIWTE
jgi:hypothetical protein